MKKSKLYFLLSEEGKYIYRKLQECNVTWASNPYFLWTPCSGQHHYPDEGSEIALWISNGMFYLQNEYDRKINVLDKIILWSHVEQKLVDIKENNMINILRHGKINI